MNCNRLSGYWKQIKGGIKAQWGRLTGSKIDVIVGKQEQLAGALQAGYGTSKEQLGKQLAAWRARQK